MVSIKNKIQLITGLLLTSMTSQASLNNSDVIRNESKSFENYKKSCDRLIELEFRYNLSEAEIVEGKLLHDLISQIAEEPLSYCDQLQMANAFEDLGSDNFL